MIVATYNIQNIFYRDRVLIKKYREENRELWIKEFETLMLKRMRTNEEFNRMRALSQLLGFEDSQHSPYFTMIHKMGQLFLKKEVAVNTHRATHLTDWNGWVKLNSNPINDIAIENKGKIIKEASADILILLEVEDRTSLLEFNKYFLSHAYTHMLYLETNDIYGRGIGVLTKEGYEVKSMKSHVNDFDDDGNPIFDMDLQEYKISTPNGTLVTVLSTCFLEDTQNPAQSNTKIEIQSKRIAEVYQTLNVSNSLIAVVGTLNVPSYSKLLSSIIGETDLRDVSKHHTFEVDLDKGKDSRYFRLGAYKMGVNIKQRDYLMLSTRLFKAVKNSGLIRKGIWFKKRPQWEMLKSIKNETHMASEHPLVWSQLKIG
ncbi:hypothetical protein [Flagellimonas sp. CMM7]|uniref:hypothetical protein n=1 Tax=Flagellimonas sp. CMM7 TaxID=2654676 RepID=UPI0013D6C4E5|nr:hypothetical protein [Flagellimonas sp. CMM7]UII80091.1 hypothetical protein LV704_00885 [Flagellimonas sp. CMM7]